MKFIAAIMMLCAACFSGEAEPLNEVTLRKAQIMAEEGHLKQSIVLALTLLRQAPDQALRENARNHLTGLGVTAQELLKLDVAALKSDDLAKIVARIGSDMRQRQRIEAEVQIATQMLRISAIPHLGADDQIQIDMKPKDLARALNMLIDISFSETAGPHQADAIMRLEILNITGGRIEMVRKAGADGKLPAEIEKEVVLAVCIERLQQNMEALGQEAPAEIDLETMQRRKLIQNFGIKLHQYVKNHFADAPLVKRTPELMDYWKAQAHVPVNQDF